MHRYVDFYIDNYIDKNIIHGELYYTISKSKQSKNKKERRARLEKPRRLPRRDSPTSSQKSSHCISVHRNPFRGGTHANVSMEISAFLDRAIFTVLFARAVRLLYVNSLTFHSLDASVYGHLSLSLSSLLFSDSSLLSLSLFLYLVSPPTRAGTSRARRSVRSPFETHA